MTEYTNIIKEILIKYENLPNWEKEYLQKKINGEKNE